MGSKTLGRSSWLRLLGGCLAVTIGVVLVSAAPASADTVTGTAGNDQIVGRNGSDLLRGLGGNDVLEGKRGNDVLLGGTGRNELSGGDGDDVLRVDGGPSRLEGGKNSDRYVFRGNFGSSVVDEKSGNKDVVEFPEVSFAQARARLAGKDLIITTPRGTVRINKAIDGCKDQVEGFRFRDTLAAFSNPKFTDDPAKLSQPGLVRVKKIGKTNCIRPNRVLELAESFGIGLGIGTGCFIIFCSDVSSETDPDDDPNNDPNDSDL